MKRLNFVAVVLGATFFACGTAAAQVESVDESIEEELELTMTLMPEGADRPDVITKSIELPPAASSRGAEASEKGRETANGARQNRQAGFDTASEARERGREFGEAMAEQARENREDAGRGNAPDEPPGPPDDIPGPPDKPQQ